MPRILIITGEASGDLHGANLAAALKRIDPSIELTGVGGGAMREAGVDLLPGIPQIDTIGLIGPSRVRALVRRVLAIRRWLKSEPWDLVVLIDNPGLNFHFAKVAKAAGRRVLYYIAPQLWAWRARRMKWIQRRVDHVVVILPFEEDLYRQAGVPCTFVGHPLLDAVAPSYDKAALRRLFRLDERAPVVGLLPGSRESEVRMLLPLMLSAAARLRGVEPTAQFLLAQAPTIQDALVHECLEGSPVSVRVVRRQANEVMAASDLLIVASGTATLQAAVIGTPMILVYKLHWFTYLLGRLLVRVPWIGLVNLVAGRLIVPELLQHEATPERIGVEAVRLLRDRTACDEMRIALRKVCEALGNPGASQRAASVVVSQCRA
jgi:lipid-A-disaccharide synthase